MSDPHKFLQIPHSRAGRITDQALDHIANAAHLAQENQTLSDADAALIMLTLPQIVQELRHRRAAMDVINDCTDLDNIRFLPAG